jgi:hypothetical protein
MAQIKHLLLDGASKYYYLCSLKKKGPPKGAAISKPSPVFLLISLQLCSGF